MKSHFYPLEFSEFQHCECQVGNEHWEFQFFEDSTQNFPNAPTQEFSEFLQTSRPLGLKFSSTMKKWINGLTYQNPNPKPIFFNNEKIPIITTKSSPPIYLFYNIWHYPSFPFQPTYHSMKNNNQKFRKQVIDIPKEPTKKRKKREKRI